MPVPETVIILPDEFGKTRVLRQGDSWGNGKLVQVSHQCTTPEIPIYAVIPQGTLWQCGECSSFWSWRGPEWHRLLSQPFSE